MKCLLAIDDLILGCATSAVRAWNWTTGRTKKDLTNILLFGGAAIDISAASFDKASLAAGAAIGYACILPMEYSNNIAIAKLEEGIYTSAAIPIELEECKQRATFYGYATLGWLTCVPRYTNDASLTLSAVGIIANSFSNFVMRAGDMPRRKNCLSRGIDSLATLIGSYRQKPKPAYA